MLLEALKGKNQKRPPVWLMRQAGRYMPSYQKYRKKYPLRDLFLTPELAAEITLLPVEELGVDAAILFSDITVAALPLGFRLDFSEGPVLEEGKGEMGMHTLEPIQKAISLIKKNLKVPLIGFAGGPFTVASYMGSDPKLLESLKEVTIQYLKMQVEAGVDVIQIFDSWANQMSPAVFKNYAKQYLKPIIDSVDVPVIFFMREAFSRAQELMQLQPSAISFDWTQPLSEVRRSVPITLQGNLNPDILFEPLDVVRKKTRELLKSMHKDPGFIANLGHGVKPGTPYSSVQCFVETVQEEHEGN